MVFKKCRNKTCGHVLGKWGQFLQGCPGTVYVIETQELKTKNKSSMIRTRRAKYQTAQILLNSYPTHQGKMLFQFKFPDLWIFR